MGRQRDIRRCALQALYQFDLGMTDRPEVVRQSLAESPGGDDSHQAGFDLAALAWEFHAEADAVVRALAPDWPTHRQPVIDRSILRLAHYEMTRTDTPMKVAINEAVELAKEFSTDKSHLFINGVLDRILRSLKEAGSSKVGATPGDSPGTATEPAE
jgi:N utilization substance protein B